MKSLPQKSILYLYSRTLLINSKIPSKPFFRISQFSTAPTQFHSSSSYPTRRYEEESRLLRVLVWWDFENCTLPAGSNVFKLAQNVTAAVRKNGIKGPVQITAFGDILQLSRANQEVLSATGINLTHVPRGGKSSADRSLLVDLMCWVSQNPPPAHIFLISADGDFANILHRLRLSNYNILLCSSDNAPAVLLSAASIMWHWHSLIRGEDLSGKHFNQPPDGPYGSWYGHYKLPLDDPLAVTGQPCSRASGSSELSIEPKLRPVPKTVVKQIRDVLNSYPEGISITDLHLELGKTNVSLDKDLYGYKKFSCFILSNSHILKIQSWGENQLSIRSITPSVEETPGVTTGPVTINGDLKQHDSGKRNFRESSASGLEDETSVLISSKANVKEPSRRLQDSPKQVKESVKQAPNTSLPVEKANSAESNREPLMKSKESMKKVDESQKIVPPPMDAEQTNCDEVSMSNFHSLEEHNHMSEVGSFKEMWEKWFGGKYSGSVDKNNMELDKHATAVKDKKEEEMKEECLGSPSQCTDSLKLSSNASASNETNVDENSTTSCEATDYISTRGLGFLDRMKLWWNGPQSDILSKSSSDEMSKTKGDDKEYCVFSDDIWNNVAAFLHTFGALEVVMTSKSRKEMAEKLQSQGPSDLRYMSVDDLLHLVDLIISKKWVDECPSQKCRFKLTLPAEEGSNDSHSSKLQPDSQNLPADEENMNVTRARATPPTGQEKAKLRCQVMQDCQKLVDFIVKKYPNGYHMSHFKDLFLERYGYSLDIGKLGYNNLTSLLQLMTGVKIDASYIKPETSSARVLKISDQKNTDSVVQVNKSVKKRNPDYPYEELEPICDNSSGKNEIIRSSRIMKEAVSKRVDHNHGTLSDDDFSESYEESLWPRKIEKDSSLLRILDTWNNKEASSPVNVNDNFNGSRKGSLPTPSGQNEVPLGSYRRKQGSGKNYTFVSNEETVGLTKSVERSAASRVGA